MVADRQQMTDRLKEQIVPHLRDRGFKGSFPHFRRIGQSKTDLLMFQFDKWGGGFVIEIGEGPVDELVQHWGERIPAAKLTVPVLSLANRGRLVADSTAETETWFRFDANTKAAFDAAAQDVLRLLPQADEWWRGKREQPNIRALT
jgi:hypothetical protein